MTNFPTGAPFSPPDFPINSLNPVNLSKDQSNSNSSSPSSQTTKTTYLEGKRDNVSLEAARDSASRKAGITKGSFMAAGALSFVLFVCVLAGAFATLATLATPVGWAIGALVLIGLAALAIRHYSMKEAGLETDTKSQLGEAVALGLGSPVVAGIAVAGAILGGIVFGTVLIIEKCRNSDNGGGGSHPDTRDTANQRADTHIEGRGVNLSLDNHEGIHHEKILLTSTARNNLVLGYHATNPLPIPYIESSSSGFSVKVDPQEDDNVPPPPEDIPPPPDEPPPPYPHDEGTLA